MYTSFCCSSIHICRYIATGPLYFWTLVTVSRSHILLAMALVDGEDGWQDMRAKIQDMGEGEWWTAVAALSASDGYMEWLTGLFPKHAVQQRESADLCER